MQQPQRTGLEQRPLPSHRATKGVWVEYAARLAEDFAEVFRHNGVLADTCKHLEESRDAFEANCIEGGNRLANEYAERCARLEIARDAWRSAYEHLSEHCKAADVVHRSHTNAMVADKAAERV